MNGFRIVLVCTCFGLAGCKMESPPPGSDAKAGAVSSDILSRVDREASCESPSKRSFHGMASGRDPVKLQMWCHASRGWDSATAPDLPAAPVALLGFSAALSAADASLAPALESPRLNALVVTQNGGKTGLAFRDITADTDEERPMIEEARAGLLALAAGELKDVPIRQPLFDFLQTLPKRESRVATRSATGWTVPAEKGVLAAEVRKVGEWWIAVEQDGSKGIWLGIYSDKLRPVPSR